MRIATSVGALLLCTAMTAAVVTAPSAAASAISFCGELHGAWDGQYCRTSVLSERKAVRDIKVAIPDDLVQDPVAGPPIRDYLTKLVESWRSVGAHMVADSFGEENNQIFRRGNTVSVVFHETYHADGPDFNNAYRTFTFDTAAGRQLQLRDVVKPGIDPLAAVSVAGRHFVEQALDAAPPPHQPGSYPFVPERWTSDKVYSGGYRAWALTSDELVLYLPDYPVAHDTPLDFTPGVMQWSMDGGTVQVRIPLTALSGILRPEYGGA
jgi:hypothetical protein